MPTDPVLRSLDIHDVLTLIDGRPELIEEVASTPPGLRTCIHDELSELRAEDYFDYAVESATASYGPIFAGATSMNGRAGQGDATGG